MSHRFYGANAVAALITVLPSPAAAGAAGPESQAWPIEAVTIHPGNLATVERQVTAPIEPGRHSLALPALPGTVRKGSLQATIEAGQGLRIIGVDAERRTRPALTAARERELKERIEEIESRKASLANRIAALQTQLGFIEGVADLPQRAGEALLSQAGSPDKLTELWNAVGEGAKQTREDRRALKAMKTDIEDELEALRQELADKGTGDQEVVKAQVRVSVPNDGGSTEARIAVRYRVTGASWKPTYTARLDTEAAELTLKRRMQVRQKTGEDWTDVALTLTTASPRRGEPEALAPWWVRFRPGPKPMQEKDTAEMARMPRGASTPGRAGKDQMATTDTGFTTRHTLPDPVDLAADNTSRTYSVADELLDVDLETRVRPQKAERGWLVAATEWDGDAPLSSGGLTRYRDGAFVGEIELDRWRPGEKRTLAFGVDPRIEVSHSAARDREGDAGWFTGDRRITRQYRVGVTNHRDTPARVVVRYRIPEPQDDAIEVALTARTPAPDVRGVDDKPGVLAWHWELGSQEQRDLPIGFKVTYPGERELSGI
ncbi:mucoidy inhibitor MuiA family protein [Thiohalorhabdus sp.]|uniref:mucoidy inhibitor MuiA family protein n=1 Tax=Thiohalorhabdus sp. TaxID=3094134 RepID=UPI002FC3AFE1